MEETGNQEITQVQSPEVQTPPEITNKEVYDAYDALLGKFGTRQYDPELQETPMLIKRDAHGNVVHINVMRYIRSNGEKSYIGVKLHQLKDGVGLHADMRLSPDSMTSYKIIVWVRKKGIPVTKLPDQVSQAEKSYLKDLAPALDEYFSGNTSTHLPVLSSEQKTQH